MNIPAMYYNYGIHFFPQISSASVLMSNFWPLVAYSFYILLQNLQFHYKYYIPLNIINLYQPLCVLKFWYVNIFFKLKTVFDALNHFKGV